MSLIAIPEELRQQPQFVVWRLESKPQRPMKVPYRIDSPAKRARVNAPHTWGSFDHACQTYSIGAFDGIGFVFTEQDPFVGIDLDSCCDPETGKIESWACGIINDLNSYTEVSSSKTGVHIIVQANWSGRGRRIKNIEMYFSGRFFCLTGDHLSGTPPTIEDRHSELIALYNRLFQDGVPPPSQKEGFARYQGPTLKEVEIITRAKCAKNGFKFRKLWEGDWRSYRSQSEADLALCRHLGFWTKNNRQLMDRLFRQSGLYRKKWDGGRHGKTYGQRTIEKALESSKTQPY